MGTTLDSLDKAKLVLLMLSGEAKSDLTLRLEIIQRFILNTVPEQPFMQMFDKVLLGKWTPAAQYQIWKGPAADATEKLSDMGKQRHCEIYRGLHEVVRKWEERFIGAVVADRSRMRRFMSTFFTGDKRAGRIRCTTLQFFVDKERGRCVLLMPQVFNRFVENSGCFLWHFTSENGDICMYCVRINSNRLILASKSNMLYFICSNNLPHTGFWNLG